MDHVQRTYRSGNMSFKQAMKQAKRTYKRGGEGPAPSEMSSSLETGPVTGGRRRRRRSSRSRRSSRR